MMTPFWSVTPGGSHSRKMEVEEIVVPAGFVAGPLGTRKERIILSEGHQPGEFYTNTSYHFTVCYWQS